MPEYNSAITWLRRFPRLGDEEYPHPKAATRSALPGFIFLLVIITIIVLSEIIIITWLKQ